MGVTCVFVVYFMLQNTSELAHIHVCELTCNVSTKETVTGKNVIPGFH